jgi:uracil-DNA glycosylase
VASSASERREALKAVWEQGRDCRRCQLHETRTTVVFGAGNADADLMFIGEAPGATEDKLGLPFVGQAGKLLDTLLGEIGLDRSEVFIANTLMCRPPGNRNPHPHELDACQGYLHSKIELPSALWATSPPSCCAAIPPVSRGCTGNRRSG